MARPRDKRPADLEEARTLPDEAIVEDMRALGVAVDQAAFREAAASFAAPERLAWSLASERRPVLTSADEERLRMLVTALWERWLPDRPTFTIIDDGMQLGYDEQERGDEAAAAEHWLRTWRSVVPLARERGLRTITQFDEAFDGTQLLFNWVQDLDDTLHSAGLQDPRFWEDAIRFSEEFLELFPDEDSLLIENKRRAMAESHAELGRRAVSDRLYRGWLDSDPAWGWGWIGWADTYFLFGRGEQRDFARAEAILRKGLAVPDVRDREDVLDRLAMLYEDSGREAEAVEVRQQIETLADQPRLIASGDPSRGSGKVSFEFGEHGPSIEELPELVARARQALADGNIERKKVGRNEPCPCGSGRKFKKCCGR
jgi:tetratricopeptide (TPR) repeat protein